MLKVSLLNTGSSGNSCILDNGDTKICIDMGLNAKTWDAKAAAQGYEMKDIDAVLITHAHNDHVGTALNKYIKDKGNKNIYTTKTVANDISRKVKLSRFVLKETTDLEFHAFYQIGSFKVMPVKMYHFGIGASRINECIGFNIYDEVNEKKYLYASDTSSLQEVVVPDGGFDLLMLESNHDEVLVQNVYELSAKSKADESKYRRTQDHLSIQKLGMWLFHNQHDAVLIPLHESSRYLTQKQLQLKEGQFYGTFFEGETNE